MKLTPNKTKRLEVRLTEEEFNLFQVASYSIGYNPSKLLRMFIMCTLVDLRKKINLGEINLEDYETILNDKL